MTALDVSTATEQPEGCGPMLQNALTPARSQRQQVFEYVRAAGAVSRIDVAKSLGVSPGTVTSIVSELMDAGLLVETDTAPRDTTRGRPPVALAVAPKARYVVGIKLSDRIHTAVLTDFAGNLVADATLDTQPHRRPAAQAIAETGGLLDRLLAKTDLDRSAISAMALGLPGIVDYETGHVAWSPLIAEEDCALAGLLSARFPFPVRIDNDANLLTMAELWFGAGRARSDFAVITVEEGLGMGLVLENQLFRGSNGHGLELGHTKVQIDGALCRCGRRGCLEAYVADYALAREAVTVIDGDATIDGGSGPALEALYEAAKAGYGPAQTIFQRAGRYLAAGIANVIQLFDPKLILLSGARMRFDYLYADEVLAEARAMTRHAGRAEVDIEIHTWGDLVWARGAAALALQILTDETLGKTRTAS
ncbi:MAG: ROK family protein [Pseudomonadota bacterium]